MAKRGPDVVAKKAEAGDITPETTVEQVRAWSSTKKSGSKSTTKSTAKSNDGGGGSFRMNDHDCLRHAQDRLVSLYVKHAAKFKEFQGITDYITKQVQDRAEHKALFGQDQRSPTDHSGAVEMHQKLTKTVVTQTLQPIPVEDRQREPAPSLRPENLSDEEVNAMVEDEDERREYEQQLRDRWGDGHD
jgi:hypothetical protein